MTATDDTLRALKRAGVHASKWTKRRDELIRQAVNEGGSLREVGAAAGLSHQAVKFISQGRMTGRLAQNGSASAGSDSSAGST